MSAATRGMRALLIAAVCAVAAGPPAAAQDEATLDAARKLIAVSKVEQSVGPLVGLIVSQMRPLLRQQAPRLTDDQFSEFEAAFEEEMQSLVPDLLEFNARSYATAFTREELEALIAFYETPVGQKAIDVLPSLMQQSMAAGATLGRDAGIRAAQKAAARMRDKGYDL